MLKSLHSLHFFYFIPILFTGTHTGISCCNQDNIEPISWLIRVNTGFAISLIATNWCRECCNALISAPRKIGCHIDGLICNGRHRATAEQLVHTLAALRGLRGPVSAKRTVLRNIMHSMHHLACWPDDHIPADSNLPITYVVAFLRTDGNIPADSTLPITYVVAFLRP